ncbi:LysR family transcriptional regulator [Vibrio maerlii]|uniref:LysR family transcriptional regulator n=1 Tax=Vibrio maerlii TaxID=2231648 RepID=UPI000E3E78A0|nr:LysR family transcriptional regulator [Vibrio maerlii]
MKNWTEFRTAYFVAETGSISGAAQKLGVHRATVLRHLDVLENEIGTKVFIRDSKKYYLTEVGEDLYRVAKLTEEQFNNFEQRASGHSGELEGDFIITSVDAMSSIIAPAIYLFNQQHPKVKTRWLSSTAQMKLEYGQAHLAIRSGPKPQDENYVVQPFAPINFGLYASPRYIEQLGVPESEQRIQNHKFVSFDQMPKSLEVSQWFEKFVSPSQIVYTSNNREVLESAIVQGVGIGFIPYHEALKYPQLKRVLPKLEWQFNNWLLTHGDLHRSKKVQAFMKILKSDKYHAEIESMLDPD